MAIHYVLRLNLRTTDPNDYYATVVPTGSLDTNEFADAMVAAGSTLRKAEVLAFIELFTTVLGERLKAGERVNLPFGSFLVSIEGVFIGADATFDPTQGHQLAVGVQQGPQLKGDVRTATTQKDVAPLPHPIVTQYKDATSHLLNSTATSGRLAEIRGDNLKFDPTKTDEGVFFVPVTGSPIKVTVFTGNTDKLLTIQNPTLTATTYHIEVRKRFGPTGALRIGALEVQLTGVIPTGPA